MRFPIEIWNCEPRPKENESHILMKSSSEHEEYKEGTYGRIYRETTES